MRRGEAAADTLPAAVSELWRMGVAVRWPAPPLTCTEPERAEYTSLSQMARQLDKADSGRGAEKGKKHCDTGASRAIPQRTTGPAQPSLTSVIGREPVLYGWYDRSMQMILFKTQYTLCRSCLGRLHEALGCNRCMSSPGEKIRGEHQHTPQLCAWSSAAGGARSAVRVGPL